MAFNRRHFLQFAGSTLTTIGLNQFSFLHQADRYGQVLAQTTRRKLALLVGINNYPDRIGALSGCLTDIELQKYLLIYRFGFHPDNILEVSDNAALKPTRSNILQAFENHLINQAKPGDVVVFHYSGHGDRIRDPNPLDTAECQQIGDCDRNGTMVPIDGLPQNNGAEVVVPDIMGQTLFLLTQALRTEWVTVVLDSCHSGAGTRGTATVRAARRRAGSDQVLIPSTAELDYQQQLISRLGLSIDEVQRQRQAGIAKGVAVGSARRNQLAMDAQFKGFNAGGFTYLLTRYLWQLTQNQACDSVYVNLKRSTNSLSELQQGRSQVPIFEYRPDRNAQQPMYFSELVSLPAEAVLLKTNPLQFWLGGVSAQNIHNDNDTIFSVINAEGDALAEIKQMRRDGLLGEGELVSGNADGIKSGMLLREKIVGIPTNPTLEIAVDTSLNGFLEEAESELRLVNRVEVVPINQGTVDYLFGRFTTAQLVEDRANLPAINSLGVFLPDSTPLVDTFGHSEEPITTAINRLRPRFKRLLVNQMLGQLLTVGSSSLQVVAKLSAVSGQGGVVAASRGAIEAGAITPLNGISRFPSGTLLQLEVENLEPEQDLYLSVLVIGSDGVMNVLYPQDWNAPEEAARIDRRGRLTVPRREDRYAFAIQGSSGNPEVLLLVSTEPLRSTLKGMQAIARGQGLPDSRGPLVNISDDDSLNTIDQLLGDINTLSHRQQANETIGMEPFRAESMVYDTSKLVVLSAVIEVIG